MTTEPELSERARRALGEAALDWVLAYWTSLDRAAARVYPAIGARELQAMVAAPLPRSPEPPADVLAQFATLADYARHNGHPRMFGYVQSSGNFAGAIGDFLASALNQNVTSWRSAPSATAVERQVVQWLADLAGVGTLGAGLLVGGGSAANQAAIAVALRASTDVDVNARGIAALPAPPVIYASERVHMSVPKAAALLGLGRDAVRTIAGDEHHRMDPAALARALAEDRQAGRHPVCVVASAGEVNTGAIDPLGDIAEVCQRHRVWLHVDGAYGGFAATVPRVSAAFAGIERADSLTLDPHKWLFAPLDAGCLLVRDEAHLRRAFSQGAAYIDVIADDDMSEFAFWDVGPELSRRFRALKLWFALKCHGADALLGAIARNIALAGELAAAVDASADFERLAPVPLSIVCFRYLPRGPVPDEASLNAINRRLLVELQRGGTSYVSNALIGPRFALRACIVNHRTTTADVPALLDDVRAAAARLGL